MTFQCDDIKQRWPEYLYRELDEHEQATFVQHLHQCEACRREEEQWKQLLTRFDTLAGDDGICQAPPDLVYRVKRQVHLYEDWSKQTLSAFRAKVVTAVAACSLFFCIFWAGAHYAKHRPPSDQWFQAVSENVLSDWYSPFTLETYREYDMIMLDTQEERVALYSDSAKPAVPNKRKQQSL
jgi:hypothetical protein